MKKILNLKDKKETRKNLRNNSTVQEIILWSRLRRSQLGFKFRRQESIGKFIVDFYCPKKKLIIEIDGCQHKELKQSKWDLERKVFLEKEGFIILRFWNNEVNNNLDGVILEIEKYLD